MRVFFRMRQGVREDEVDLDHAIWLLRLKVAYLSREEAEHARSDQSIASGVEARA
jgi:hypothetical protein